MNPLYPHVVDRHRLLQRIFKALREAAGLSQAALAARAFVAQSTISNAENLDKGVDRPNRRITRDHLLRLVTWGLELAQTDLTVLLWLYDGSALDAEDIRRYLRGYLPRAQPGREDAAALRTHLFALLDRLLVARSSNSGALGGGGITAHMQLLFSSAADELRGEQALLQLEKIPGQRLFFSDLPSRLTHPPDTHRRYSILSALIRSSGNSKLAETSWDLTEQRVHTFLTHLARYGERSIHSRTALTHYLSDSPGYHLSLAQRHEHIQHWIQLLRDHPHYEVALVEDTPDLEVEMKPGVAVLLRAKGAVRHFERETAPEQSLWGPRYLVWDDEASALSFTLAFERYWHALAPGDRSKDEIVGYLEALVAGVSA
ncbi:MAG: hypothetical protein CL878_14655 [Dehalococcoidia bacterium]|nr:hypothetical protein [Dehalococcoidia bacterium]